MSIKVKNWFADISQNAHTFAFIFLRHKKTEKNTLGLFVLLWSLAVLL